MGLIISRSSFRSWTGHPPSFLPRFLPLYALCRIAGHSIYISVLLPLWQEFPWLRYPPGGEPIGFCLLHLSLVSSHSSFLPLFYLSLSLSSSLSLLAAHRRFCSRSLSSTRSPRLVRQSDAIMTSEENERRRPQQADCTDGCILHSSIDIRGDQTFTLTLRILFYIRRFVELKVSFMNQRENFFFQKR